MSKYRRKETKGAWALTALQANQEREQEDRRGVLPVGVVRRVRVYTRASIVSLSHVYTKTPPASQSALTAKVQVPEERTQQARGIRAPCERWSRVVVVSLTS